MARQAKGKTAPETLGFDCDRRSHQRCLKSAMERATDKCKQDGLRLTPLRKQVLEVIWQGHEPLGAYKVLAELSRDRDAVAPPTVYRALAFLVEAGLVHRIDSLNAYVGCTNPHPDHAACLLICDSCGRVSELEDSGVRRALQACSAQAGFSAKEEVVEIKGTCRSCAKSA